LRLAGHALLVGLDVGHDRAQVLGREREGHVGDGRGGVAQARPHLNETAPRIETKRPPGLGTLAPAPTGPCHALHVVSGTTVSPERVETSTDPVLRHVRWPNRARRPASRALLVQTASAPPMESTR